MSSAIARARVRPSRWIAAARSAASTASALSASKSVRETLMLLRHDGHPDRPARQDRFVEELGRGLGDVGARAADLPHLELARARGVADPHDPTGRLDP